jgi:hypothetical protein
MLASKTLWPSDSVEGQDLGCESGCNDRLRFAGVGYVGGSERTAWRRATCDGSRSMRSITRFVGLDVHAETIAVAIAEPGGEVRSLGTIPNRPEPIRRLARKLGEPKHLRACYEA